MRRFLVRLAPALRLTRVTTGFAAVSNVWFVVLWTRGSVEDGARLEGGAELLWSLPVWLLLCGATLNALGLFGFAAALNDVLDQRRDEAFGRDRPIASGRISVERAVALVALTFMCAVLGATLLGTEAVLLTVLVSGAALFFNGVGKFVPAVGAVVLGLMYAGQMVVPNIHLKFVWPVWLVMTHSLGVALLTHWLGRRVPVLSRRAVIFSVLGWLFWTGVMATSAWVRGQDAGGLWPAWVNGWAWLLPGLLALGYAFYVWRRVTSLGRGTRSAEKVARYGALWLSFYSCAWLIGQGLWAYAGVLGTLALAGWLGMTVVREVFAAFDEPMEYRR